MSEPLAVSDDAFEIIVYVILLGSLLGFLGWFFARYVIGRRRIASGNRALGIVNFEYFQTADGKRAVQEILFTQEAWEETHEDGDPPVPGQASVARTGIDRSRGAD